MLAQQLKLQAAGLQTLATAGCAAPASQTPLAAAAAAAGQRLLGAYGVQPLQQQQFHCLAFLAQQRRGLAMKLSGFRPRQKNNGLADRKLPARNEQITAPEVSGR